MPLGGLRGSTPIPSPVIPQAYASYDPITRRKVRFIETIVPTLQLGDTVDSSVYPADRYYAHFGALDAATSAPFWATPSAAGSFQQWDASEEVAYWRMSDAGLIGITGNPDFIYPLGPFGASPSYAPKNTTVAMVRISFKARFNANADYTDTGIGAHFGGSLPFNTASHHFIQVLRNAGNWELGSSDGTTLSQSSAAGADGSWHEFRVEWDASELRLYVDGTLTITKTTNRPAHPLSVAGVTNGTTNTIDLVDYLVEWE